MMQIDCRSPLSRSWHHDSFHTPTSPAALPVVSFDHPTVFHDPVLFRPPVLSPHSLLSYDLPVRSTSCNSALESGLSLHGCLRSPSPFSAGLLTPLEPAELYSEAADASPQCEPTPPLCSQSPVPSSPSLSLAVSLSSSLSASSLTSPPPPSPPLPPSLGVKRTRERIRGLSREQRAERKRSKHRLIDASRRQKEIAAMNSLRQLTKRRATSPSQREEEERAAEQQSASNSAKVEECGDVVSKAVVLESSVELIRHLQSLCTRMQEACNAKDAHIARLASDLQTVIHDCNEATSHDTSTHTSVSQLCVAATRRVDDLARSSFLHQSTCLSSALCIAVLSMPLSLILDCNSAFVKCAGWSREQLLRSIIKPPTDSATQLALTAHPDYRVCPFMIDERRGRRWRPAQSTGSVSSDCTVSQYVSQYRSSVAEMGALISGSKHKVEFVWRVRAGTGEMYEVQMSAWRDDDRRLNEAGGDTQQSLMACRVVTAHSMYDKVRVDELALSVVASELEEDGRVLIDDSHRAETHR